LIHASIPLLPNKSYLKGGFNKDGMRPKL
jgi:hypothetical protein